MHIPRYVYEHLLVLPQVAWTLNKARRERCVPRLQCSLRGSERERVCVRMYVCMYVCAYTSTRVSHVMIGRAYHPPMQIDNFGKGEGSDKAGLLLMAHFERHEEAWKTWDVLGRLAIIHVLRAEINTTRHHHRLPNLQLLLPRPCPCPCPCHNSCYSPFHVGLHYLGPSFSSTRVPSSSHSCFVIHMLSLSAMMLASTAPPRKTM